MQLLGKLGFPFQSEEILDATSFQVRRAGRQQLGEMAVTLDYAAGADQQITVAAATVNPSGGHEGQSSKLGNGGGSSSVTSAHIGYRQAGHSFSVDNVVSWAGRSTLLPGWQPWGPKPSGHPFIMRLLRLHWRPSSGTCWSAPVFDGGYQQTPSGCQFRSYGGDIKMRQVKGPKRYRAAPRCIGLIAPTGSNDLDWQGGGLRLCYNDAMHIRAVTMFFQLPPLPYNTDALAPHISAAALECHYEQHHRGYLNALNAALASGSEAATSLEQLLKTTRDPNIFNLAAQVWNHNFYWNCLAPDGGGEPPAALEETLAEDFGSVHGFRRQLATAADAVFGSGWVWLIRNHEGRLAIDTTGNAGNPLVEGNIPLLTLDVWEHAYYLDYRNARGRYIDNFLTHLINWQFVEQNLQSLFRPDLIEG